jgi:hypothetical protein
MNAEAIARALKGAFMLGSEGRPCLPCAKSKRPISPRGFLDATTDPIALVAVTGNGLTVTEDLARRFILCELDARCEDPETRPFAAGFLKDIERQRSELLTAALTIWRWGRQNTLARGKPLGSFERWAEWCRDPLVALGCCDSVERVEQLKGGDPHRQRDAELFHAWWQHHGAAPMKVNDLADPVKAIADSQGRGRQYLATFFSGLAGTHAAGFVLTRQEPAGKWTAATYALTEPAPTDPTRHRTHRSRGPDGTGPISPMSPMSPIPDAVDDDADVRPEAETAI